MKRRFINKVLGLLLLLPLFSGCNDTDDVAGIFTGKTWKLTYITVKDDNKMVDFWGTDNEARKKSYDQLEKAGTYNLIFSGAVEDNTIKGQLKGTLITASITGAWSANGDDNKFHAAAEPVSETDILAKKVMEGLNSATSYLGDDRNLYLYYTPKGSQQTFSLVFRVVK